MLEKKVDNKSLNKNLINKDHISQLEFLINENSKNLENLKRKNPDFGITYEADELPRMFRESKKFVDDFLDVKPGGIPKYGYPEFWNNRSIFLCSVGSYFILEGLLMGSPLSLNFGIQFWIMNYFMHKMSSASSFNFFTNKITLEKTPSTIIKTVAAHEYTHYIHGLTIQNELKYRKHASLFEGHAIGVQKAAARHFRDKYDNESYMFHIFERSVGELKSTYLWICDKLEKEPNKNIKKIKSRYDSNEKVFKFFHKSPSNHSAGNSIFSLAEEKHGTEIYRRTLKKDFDFLYH